jgi:hypothetical protein
MATSVTPQQAALVIRSALDLVRARSSAQDTAYAAIAGLRLIRANVLEHAGYAAMRQVDDWLFESLSERRRQCLISRGRVGDATLPEPGGGAAGASIILCDAVLSCFFLNYEGGNAPMLVAADNLLEALIASVEGLPAWGDLIDVLTAGIDEDAFEGDQATGLVPFN